MRQQVCFCLAIAELFRLKLLILALGRTANALAVLALPGRVLFPVFLPVPGVSLLSFLERALLPLEFRDISTLELHAHSVKPLGAEELHDVEQVDDYLCLRELLLDDAHHAVREVHCHLLDLPAALLGYLLKMPRHVSNGRPLDGGYQRALPAVAVLVGEEGEQVVLQCRLVNAQPFAHVLLQQHPFVGMLSLLPVLKAAQVLLVDAAQILAVSPEEAPHALGRYWEGVQPFFLRSPQTLLSSRSLPPQGGGFQGSHCACPCPTSDGGAHGEAPCARAGGSH